MGIAKRVNLLLEEGRITEKKADRIMEAFNDSLEGHDKNGQLLLFGRNDNGTEHFSPNQPA